MILPFIPWAVCGAFYGFYFLVLKLTMMRVRLVVKKGAEKNTDFILPTISIIVPTYNEGTTIGSMIRNTLTVRYPPEKMEVLVVDGGSTDETCGAVEQFVEDKRVTLVRQQSRGGWNRAVEEGLRHARGDILVLSGSDVFYDGEAMIRLCAHFGDPEVGAVTGRQVLFNEDETFVTRMEREYQGSQDFVNAAESVLDQPFYVRGEIVAVKKWIMNAAVERVGNKAGGSLDACVSFETKAQGQRLVFDPEATYSEYTPSTARDRLGMQVRRGKSLIESAARYVWMIWRPRFGTFGMLILPYHLAMLTVLPWIFFLGSVLILAAVLSHAYYLAVFIPAVGVALHKRGRMWLASFVLAQVSLGLAMCSIATRRTYLIKRIDSTRRIPEPLLGWDSKRDCSSSGEQVIREYGKQYPFRSPSIPRSLESRFPSTGAS